MSIGIVLVEMPRMLREVVKDVLGVEPDLCVVADGVEVGALIETVQRERADIVVLWGESHTPPEMCEDLLSRFPQLAVLALEDRGQRGSIYMMRPMRVRVSDISRTQLVTAIRRAAAPAPFMARTYDAGSSASFT